MKRLLLPTKPFIRSAKRLTRKNPDAAEDVQLTLELLAEDAFRSEAQDTQVEGHNLAGSWACSAGYDLRVVFQFVKHKAADAILVEAVGTRHEVY